MACRANISQDSSPSNDANGASPTIHTATFISNRWRSCNLCREHKEDVNVVGVGGVGVAACNAQDSRVELYY